MVPAFFIFGAERSGTTLLVFLLSGQPDTFVVNDSFVFDRFAEWSLLGRPPAEDPRRPRLARLRRLARLAPALGPALARRLATGTGGLRSRYDAARADHLARYRPDSPLSAAQADAYRAFLRARYLRSLGEGREKFLNEYADALDAPSRDTTAGALFRDTLLALADLYGGGGRRAIGEKTPLHTFQADWILRFHPEARAILLVRDPVANVGSMLRRMQSLERAIGEYDRYARHFLRLKDHERVLTVRHEDVIADTPAALARMLAFLGPGLRFDPSCPVHAYTKRNATGTAVDEGRTRWAEDALGADDRERVRRRFRAVYRAFYD